MIEVVNETLAPSFYEQMRIGEAIAREEWEEIKVKASDPNLVDVYGEVAASYLSSADYVEHERDRAFYNMTRNCINELRRCCVMELS